MIPKRVKALAAIPTRHRTHWALGLGPLHPCDELGNRRMGLISNDHQPRDTSIYDWQVVTDKGEHLGRVYGSANDIEQWHCVCSDTCRDGRPATIGSMPHPEPFHFAYTGKHPAYRRLFPMPTC